MRETKRVVVGSPRRLVKALSWAPAAMLSGGIVAGIRCYQVLISPLIGPQCRFTPTCSEYFILSIRKYGPLAGSWRGVKRVLRCHPYNPGGHDPP